MGAGPGLAGGALAPAGVAWWQGRRFRHALGRVALYGVLSLGSASFLLPFYYLVNMALSTPEALAKFPPDLNHHL